MTTEYQNIGLTNPITFLDATVVSFNGNLGVGSQESSLTVELVEDCDSGQTFAGGFPDSLIGSPVCFPENPGGMNFSFCGIITNWTRNIGTSGNTYSVTLTDPRRILENCTLIIDTYAGTALNNIPNVFNVYNFYESESAITSGQCSTFGTSGISGDRGISYQAIINALQQSNLTIRTPTGSPLSIDLSDLPSGFPPSYRANGPSMTLLQLITDVCDATGYDFYVYLNSNSVIKIGLVDLRQNPSSFSYIQGISGYITDRSFGRELRIEKQNSIIFGEKRHYMATASNFLPYFGENTRCEPVTAVPGGGSCGFNVLVYTKPLAASLRNPGVFAGGEDLYINEFDLRANYELWVDAVLAGNADLSSYALTAKAWFEDNGMTGNFANAFFAAGNGIKASAKISSVQDVTAGNPSQNTSRKTQEYINEDAKKIHGYIESLRQTYYGKQFLCTLSENICVGNTQDIMTSGNSASSVTCLSTEKFYSAEPTNDGGWVETGGTVMGVSDPYLGFFRQDDGRVGAFAKFTTGNVGSGRKLNLDNISADEVLVNDNGSEAYVKAEVGEKIYKINNQTYVLIKFSDACLTTLNSQEAQFPAAFLAAASAIAKSSGLTSGGSGVTNQAMYICDSLNMSSMNEAVSGLDVSSTNKYQLTPGAVTPIIAAIPMRSNISTYGPYSNPNIGQNAGGCSAEQNTDLAPWVFGGSNAMNTAGNLLARLSQMGLNQAESGSVTLVGLPDLPFLGNDYNSNPNLSGINVNFGSSGITTTYTFQTFTPKFGDLAKSAVEQMKNAAKNRQKQLQFLRNQAIMSHNINRKLKTVGGGTRKPADKNVADGQTLHRCMIADMKDWYEQPSGDSQRTVVGIDTLPKSVLELRFNYAKKAFMSLDGLFGPVCKAGDNGCGLPRYANYQNNNFVQINKTNSSPLSPQPPFDKEGNCNDPITMDQYNLRINQKYLDPLTNKVSGSNHHHDGDGAGHAIDLLGRGDTPPDETMLMNALAQNANNRYSEDYRFLGLRGPLVLHAWGYDLDGKPVPNEADTDAAAGNGTFKDTELKDKFLKDWLNKPKTWPVAPVDLRFDRERGMWVSPQAYKIVVAKIVKKVSAFGEGRAILINEKGGNKYYKNLYDENGELVAAADQEGKSCESTGGEKEYKWILVNAGLCSKKYYCYTIGGQSSECKQSNLPNGEYLDPIRGPIPPVGGPYDSCAGNPCKQFGACCYSDICEDGVEKQDCETYYGGTFYLEKTCDDIDSICRKPGACCYYSTDRDDYYGCDENIPKNTCESEGGVHYLGKTCDQANCEPPTTTPAGTTPAGTTPGGSTTPPPSYYCINDGQGNCY